MKLGVEINGVLRDTLKKIQMEYEKWFIDNPFIEEDEGDIERKIISELDSLNIMEHLSFRDEDELYDFLYKEHTMEIFGHSPSTEYTSMNDFNNFYIEFREKLDIIIVSDEIGKSKPASLFFLSKFGCLVENIKFYSESTLQSMWDSVDILLTANPSLLLEHPKDKMVIKYDRNYNVDIDVKHSISSIKELKNKITEIYGERIE